MTVESLPGTKQPTMEKPARPADPDVPTATPAPFEPTVEVVASNLKVPWALAWAPDGRLFFTERPGRLRVIVDGELEPEPVLEPPVAPAGEGGLMGIALDPAFPDRPYIYMVYTYREGIGLYNRVARYTLEGNTASDEVVLVEGIPGSRVHDGGRVAFGPDGKLYVTCGEAGQPRLAQDLDSLSGSILRMNPDGSVPDDNPFEESLIYSYGHRNPQGLAWQPRTQQLFSTEHGPSGEMGLCCRDEVNMIVPGGNYGWPEVTLKAEDPAFVDPILTSGASNTWAPASAAFYQGRPLGPWKDNLFFGALRGVSLHRIVLGGPEWDQVLGHEVLFENEYGRIRTAALGPDGYLYFTTSNRDGRGRPAPDDDRILRIVPGE
jgi:glucose/arabinose dehydrogenase